MSMTDAKMRFGLFMKLKSEAKIKAWVEIKAKT